jgi:hypothetical protein
MFEYLISRLVISSKEEDVYVKCNNLQTLFQNNDQKYVFEMIYKTWVKPLVKHDREAWTCGDRGKKHRWQKCHLQGL